MALERELSGFDDDDFIRQFESAGGIWLDLPEVHETYGRQTYDGHHLPREWAQTYSRDLAQKILEHQP